MQVLAGKVEALQNAVKYRSSFWPTLRRDISRNHREQPFYFYGAIFALFFGVCTLIQTVASVWSLKLALHPSPVTRTLQNTTSS